MAHKTYQMGQRRKRNWRLILVVLLALLLAGGGYYLYKMFQQDTQTVIKNSAGTTRPMEIPNNQAKHFDQGNFAFDAPSDWKLTKHDTAPYNLFSYNSTLTNADNRSLDVYTDTLPQTLAVNKAVDVRAQSNNLSHGTVSENCTTFTSGSQKGVGMQGSTSAKPLTVPAKWNGVEFLCDNDNTTRNVVGTSSPGAVNKVTLISPDSGPHSFFFVYTDNNATPDYSIFYRMLESFTVK